MIYFLQAETGDKHIKIGFTDIYNVRSKQLTKQHGKLMFLGVMEGDKKFEYQLHAKFKDFRINRHQEWFRAVPEIFAYIKDNTSPDEPDVKNVNIIVSQKASEMLKLLKHRFDVNTTSQVLDLILQDYDAEVWGWMLEREKDIQEFHRQQKQSS